MRAGDTVLNEMPVARPCTAARQRLGWNWALTATRNGTPLVPSTSACRSEEHTSELQSLMRISYAVFCLKKKTKHDHNIPKVISKHLRHNTSSRDETHITI